MASTRNSNAGTEVVTEVVVSLYEGGAEGTALKNEW